MKKLIRNKYFATIALISFVAFSCDDDRVQPVLPDSDAFEAPILTNAATSTPVVLTPETAGELYEKFDWEKANYGVQVSTNYVVEVDVDDTFSAPQKLAETSTNTASVSKEKLNAAMLALGLPGFEESTVYIRVTSKINNYENDALASGVIERTATTYQNSNCGNFCSVGIVGSASPGGWDIDTDLHLADASGVDKSTWTTIIYLATGEVKFRAMDGWDVNWGAAGFPTGTGTQGGANIPIATAGYYKVTFNDGTGAYTFTALTTPTFATIGIVGTAQPGGWDSDTDMVQDGTDPHVWTKEITLTAGEMKFRADNDWANNWGAASYPSGYGTGGGDNVPVAVGGTYFVRFNDATGEFSVMATGASSPFATIGLVGPAQAGGWVDDTDLTQNPANPYLWSKVLTITEAEAKFRADNDWANNWGGSTFPFGIGQQNGANIPAKAGKYFITLNTGTGEYTFLK